jgi:hypothetical protein
MSDKDDKRPWSFDVSSLMVLINENEELNARLSQLSLVECLSAVPVIGLQTYIRSYDLLLEPGPFTYFSPYGCKSAPLRNMKLAMAINRGKLLQAKRFTVFRVPGTPQNKQSGIFSLIMAWTLATWILFGGLLAFTLLVPNRSWVGIASCTVITGWSIILRLVEHFNIKPEPVESENVTAKDSPDAIFIMGRNSSAFVLEGSRKSIKDWTARGLVYKSHPLGVPASVWQGCTRVGSLLVLLFIFTAIPNGTTMDQMAFIIINLLAQFNVVVVQKLSSWCYLEKLDKVVDVPVETRTHVYGELVRRFKDVEAKKNWVDVCGLLPRTDVWDEWKSAVMSDSTKDAKEVYQEVAKMHSKK